MDRCTLIVEAIGFAVLIIVVLLGMAAVLAQLSGLAGALERILP